MTSLKKNLIEDNLPFKNITNTYFFFLEEKILKEYTAKIILHYLKNNSNDVLKIVTKLDIGKSTSYKFNSILLEP